MKKIHCIIVGGGPAGTSCAIYLKRSNIDTLVIENGAGALKFASIENYYGIEKISGTELYNIGLKQLNNLGVDIVHGEVLGIEYADNGYLIKTKSEEYQCTNLVIATGTSRKTPNIKNLSNFEGKGVSFCAVCDGFLYRNEKVAVVGNGDYALNEAKHLKQIGANVTILLNGKSRDFDSEEFEVIDTKISSIEGNNQLDYVMLENGDKKQFACIFVAIGTANATDFARKLGIEFNDNKIKVNDNFETNVPNVYAIGDAVGGTLQVAKAVADGMKCALQIISKQK